MKKIKFLGISLFSVIAFLIFTLPATVVSAKEITLNWASFLPKNNPETKSFQKLFIDRVNERTKGELFIRYRGGPESIPPTDLGSAVQSGVIDIATTIVGFYESIVPGVGALMLTELTLEEERQSSALTAYLEKLHSPKGLKYLGRAAASKERFFYFFLNKKVEKPSDFKNLRLGTATAMRAASKAWGASVTPLRLSEYFSAMERNLVDGIPSSPIVVWVAFGAHEVTKYVLDTQFYVSTATAIMNAEKWNRLPQKVKDIMNEELINFQNKKIGISTMLVKRSRKKMMDSGVEFYKLAPEHEKWLVDTAYEAAWDYQHKRFPKETDMFRKLLTK